MNKHPFDILPVPQGGSFIFTPCPGTKQASMSEAVADLSEAGAEAIVTLNSDKELESLGMLSLRQEIRSWNLLSFQFPIDDDAEPEAPFELAYSSAKAELLGLINEGKTIAIHCRGGSGRTGMMAAILLMDLGMSWEEVKPKIQQVRPKALQHPAHLNYLRKAYKVSAA